MEICGEVAEGEIVGMRLTEVIASDTASVTPLASGPTMPSTPSISISRRASSIAAVLSSCVSPTTSRTGRPSTPPASLTCCTASRTPVSIAGPNSAIAPE